MPSSVIVEKFPAASGKVMAWGVLLALCLGVRPAAASDGSAPVVKPPKPLLVQATPLVVPTAMTPPPAPADPMDQLRLRLAERLAAGKAAAVETASSDLRVVARAAAASAAGGAVRSPATKTSTSRSADLRTGHAAAASQWTYAGAGGPPSWGGACSSGQRQSPIDIRGGLAVDLEPVHFAYTGSRFGVIDNGRTLQVNVAAGNHIAIGGKRFELQQFHFHRPSEERIDGRQFEMSVHLVHKDEQGRLAVVTVLLDKGPGLAQPVVQKVWNNLPLERGEEAAARAPLDLNELLPVDRKYYTYMGSLTTPPCSEGVQWIVMRHPVTVSAEQVELFARIYPMNSRPLQAVAGRRILQSN